MLDPTLLTDPGGDVRVTRVKESLGHQSHSPPSRQGDRVRSGGSDGHPVAIRPQILRDERELVQRGLKILGDLGRQRVGIGQVGAVLQALVAQPEDVRLTLSRCSSSSYV